MQLQNRKIDLELFKERAEALQQAGVVWRNALQLQELRKHPTMIKCLLAGLHSVTNKQHLRPGQSLS